MSTSFGKNIKDKLSPRALFLLDEPLAPVTSFHIGGPAEFLLIPSSKEDVQQAVKLASESNIPWRLLGSGSNVIVPDAGLPGLTIKFWHNFDSIEVADSLLIADAGVDMLNLSRAAAKAGFSGLEWACGIPGTVGGAVYMNAGVKQEEIKDYLLSATVLTEKGELQSWDNAQFQFSYRTSALQHVKAVVLDVTFQMPRGEEENIYQKMNKHLNLRSTTQPIDLPNCGSVFRNPQGDFSGRLIEAAGLKGFRLGGVQVSEQHANFIVNTANGTAEDVVSLIKHIKETVYAKFGVQLQEEVRLMK